MEAEFDNGYDLSIGHLVRCMDCRFSIAGGFGCVKWSDFENVHPKGFCAWGERRVVE